MRWDNFPTIVQENIDAFVNLISKDGNTLITAD